MLEQLIATATSDDTADDSTTAILDAALAEFTEFGIRRTSIAEVAKRAGVHRATVYRRYPTKDELVSAALLRWAGGFFAAVADAVAHLPTVEERLVEGFTVCHRTIRDDPFAARMLSSEPEVTLPFLTINGGPIIAAVRDFLVAQRRAAGDDRHDITETAEIGARLGLSLLLTPESSFDLQTDEQRRDFARRHITGTPPAATRD
jgi:AcrR family transcriptional regulator